MKKAQAADQPIDDESCEDEPLDIPVVGDLADIEADVTEKLLSVPIGGECVLYFNSPGGSPHSAISLMTLIASRGLNATGIVTGECSSAALWPLAACQRRIVTPYSVLLFHPMKAESEENISIVEATEWVRYFHQLEVEMDQLLARFFQLSDERLGVWIRPGRFVTGPEFAEAGLAELMELKDFAPKASG